MGIIRQKTIQYKMTPLLSAEKTKTILFPANSIHNKLLKHSSVIKSVADFFFSIMRNQLIAKLIVKLNFHTLLVGFFTVHHIFKVL